MRHIVLLAHHLRSTAESHDVLGLHGGSLHGHFHGRDLILPAIVTPAKNERIYLQ